MATKKQERERLRRRHDKVQAAAAARASDQARLRIIATIVGVLVVVCLLLWWAGSTFSSVTPGRTVTVAGCEEPPTSFGTGAQLTLPDKATAEGKTFEATLTTNCGDIVLELDGTKAPQAVASFLQLARADYWLNAPCHRLVRSPEMTVLQCGDPTGSGQGTPGYGFAVENAPADGVYARGAVAMARTTDPVAGNGGQFFLVDQQTTIADTAGYTVFGTVSSGLDIVDKIVAAGVAGGAAQTDGAPNAPISILRVAVTEKKAQP